MAKSGPPLLPILQRNHPSWEDDEYAREVLIPVLSEWLLAGSLEYVDAGVRRTIPPDESL